MLPKRMVPLRVGLIGCGRVAQFIHLDTLMHLRDVDLVAIAEIDAQRRAEGQQIAPRADTFSDYREMLESVQLDAVVICVPPEFHAEIAIAALNAGKHIYLEKPMATNLAEAYRIIDAWRHSGAKAMMGFNYRRNPLNLEARKVLEKGRVGRLMGGRTVFSDPADEIPTWLQHRSTAGGALLELGSHHLDLIPYLLGSDILEVDAKIRSLRTEDDSVALTMRLADDMVIQSYFMLGPSMDDRIEVFGREATLIVDRFRSLRVQITREHIASPRLRRLQNTLGMFIRSPLLGDDLLAPQRESSYASAFSYFFECLQKDDMPSPDLWDGYKSLAAVEAAKESARTGRAAPVLGNPSD